MGPLPETVDDRNTNVQWTKDEEENESFKDLMSEEMITELNDVVLTEISNTMDLTIVDAKQNDIDLPDLIKDSANMGTCIKTHQQIPQGAHYITKACVSGFVPIRHRLQEINDMAYVVDVTWSDGRTHMVKRTFSDFYNFHFCLLDEWGTEDYKHGPLRLTFYLPERQNGEIEPSIEVAECRELQLNKYVQELMKLPQNISASPTVLTFFESRGSDPKPYRETINPSQMEVADQYVLCWI